MTFIWSWIIGSKLGRAVGSLAAALALLAGAVLWGRNEAMKAQELQDLKDFQDTKEKIDEVDKSTTHDDALERLRRNGWL